MYFDGWVGGRQCNQDPILSLTLCIFGSYSNNGFLFSPGLIIKNGES